MADKRSSKINTQTGQMVSKTAEKAETIAHKESPSQQANSRVIGDQSFSGSAAVRPVNWLGLVIFVVGLSIFLLDVAIPVSVAVAICYAVVILASYCSQRDRATIDATLVGSVLCLIVYVIVNNFSDQPNTVWGIAHSLLVIWLTGGLCLWQKNPSRFLIQLQEQQRLAEGESVDLEHVLHDLRTSEDSRKQLALIIETTTEFIGVCSVDGKVQYVNRAGRRMMGFGETEDVTQLSVADFHSRPVLEYVQSPAFAHAIVHGSWSGESAFLTRDGRQIPIWMSLVSHKNANGEVESLSTITRDLTKLKETQQQQDHIHQEFAAAARMAGMAEVATGVLHNVGNVLNSVNVSANLLLQGLHSSRVASLAKASDVIAQQGSNLGNFLTADPRGKHFPDLLKELATNLLEDRDAQLAELQLLIKNIEHVKEVINMQQTYAQVGGAIEPVNVVALIKDALKINDAGLIRHGVRVISQFDETPLVATQKHKVLQILVNLISNAKFSLDACGHADKQILLKVIADESQLRIQVCDNGIGINRENLTKIFAHGFTTRKEGHGFGLHSSALAAQELGGSLSVHSDGPAKGATFTLRLPTTTEVLSRTPNSPCAELATANHEHQCEGGASI